MAEKKIDDSPFLSKMETFEISDKKNKVSKNHIKDGYKNLENEFNFDEEKAENDEHDNDKVNEKNKDKKEINVRTIKIDRKNLKKMFSSQFFTQTLTDDSSSETVNAPKLSRKYFICEFFKRFFILLLFFITSFYAFFYIYNNYFGKKHICSNLDLYNYKYEDEVRFIPSISNKNYYIFTGKFPFDVITYKLRKDVLKKSMNEELQKYKRDDFTDIYEQIENIDDHQIQILSFMKYNNKMKCEKKIFDLYTPFYLKTTDTNIKNYDYILNEVNYNFITNPYNIPEKKLYMEILNFVKKSENQNKICLITSYLKSLKEDNDQSNRILNENNSSNENSLENRTNRMDDNNYYLKDTQNKRYLKNGNSNEGQRQLYRENNFNDYNNETNLNGNNNNNFNNNNYNDNNNNNNFNSNNYNDNSNSYNNNNNISSNSYNSNNNMSNNNYNNNNNISSDNYNNNNNISSNSYNSNNNMSNNNYNNNNNISSDNYNNNNKITPKKKIIFLYDSYDNNLVELIVAIYNMQYGNTFNNLKEHWEELKKKFKIIHPEEIYLFEWYCLAINYNIIENNNQYKLKCVDLLK